MCVCVIQNIEQQSSASSSLFLSYQKITDEKCNGDYMIYQENNNYVPYLNKESAFGGIVCEGVPWSKQSTFQRRLI